MIDRVKCDVCKLLKRWRVTSSIRCGACAYEKIVNVKRLNHWCKDPPKKSGNV